MYLSSSVAKPGLAGWLAGWLAPRRAAFIPVPGRVPTHLPGRFSSSSSSYRTGPGLPAIGFCRYNLPGAAGTSTIGLPLEKARGGGFSWWAGKDGEGVTPRFAACFSTRRPIVTRLCKIVRIAARRRPRSVNHDASNHHVLLFLWFFFLFGCSRRWE